MPGFFPLWYIYERSLRLGIAFYSRRKFTDKEAASWWDKNQLEVYQSYGIEEYVGSNHDQDT